jgi:hypothetical protein
MNLSSSDEEEDHCYSSNDDDIQYIQYIQYILYHNEWCSDLKTSSGSKLLVSTTPPMDAATCTYNHHEYNHSDSEEYDDIDWEDASVTSNNGGGQQDHTVLSDTNLVLGAVSAAATATAGSWHRKFSTKDVTIHGWEDPKLSNDDKSNRTGLSKGKMDKRRRINKIRNISNHMQRFVRDLHRTPMVCLISRGIFLSGSILGSMEDEIWSIAHSLIPSEFVFMEDEEPNFGDAVEKGFVKVPCWPKGRKFCMWFFDLVNNVEKRRNEAYASNIAAGAPRSRRTRKTNTKKESKPKESSFHNASNSTTNQHYGNYWSQKLRDIMEYLSPSNDENPQQHQGQSYLGENAIIPLEKVIMFICFTRSLNGEYVLCFRWIPWHEN